MANVDLRPMSLGEVLDRTFTLYRERFLLFAGIAALPQLLLLLFRFGVLAVTRVSAGSAATAPSAGLIGGAVAGGLLGALLMLFTFAVAQAATIWAVSELYLGRETTIRDAYLQSKGQMWVVIGISIMVGLATIVGLLLLIIPGIILACRLAISVPVAIVEQESPVASMERSMDLTRGYFWQMFLLLFLVAVLTYIVTFLLQLPVVAFTVTAAMAKQAPALGAAVFSHLAEFVSSVLVGPIGTISASLMYYNLRVKKEGFDIQHLFSSLGAAASPKPLEL
jgi:hypothetical protein